ncbi:MAG: hypothetical protein FWE70_08235 [Oscillospiraceae bacterium]|nr:hypothetical protein [Oscillospiraceae bacterium]
MLIKMIITLMAVMAAGAVTLRYLRFLVFSPNLRHNDFEHRLFEKDVERLFKTERVRAHDVHLVALGGLDEARLFNQIVFCRGGGKLVHVNYAKRRIKHILFQNIVGCELYVNDRLNDADRNAIMAMLCKKDKYHPTEGVSSIRIRLRLNDITDGVYEIDVFKDDYMGQGSPLFMKTIKRAQKLEKRLSSVIQQG